jgi:hypothetical protein
MENGKRATDPSIPAEWQTKELDDSIAKTFDDNEDFFAGLGSDFDGGIESGPDAKARVEMLGAKDTGLGLPVTHSEQCSKCGGSGRFYGYSGRVVGNCFACKGKGVLSFKTSAKDRADNRAKAATRKANAMADSWSAFAESHPIESEWIRDNAQGFAFAQSMRDAVQKYGALTDGQLGAVRRCIARNMERDAERKARVESALPLDTSAIESAFAKAGTVLQSPKLRVAGFVISRAKSHSANAGGLYVKGNGGTYLGKILGGKFFRSRECTDADESSFRTVAKDPQGAAIAYGRLTGSCACCGRTLTDPESIARGIGPICADNFGW